MSLKTFKEGILMIQSAVSVIRSVKDFFPKGSKSQELEDALTKAENKLKLSEATFAKDLGYPLCKCTWPPQIMISIGEVDYGQKYKCPGCKKIISDDDMP